MKINNILEDKYDELPDNDKFRGNDPIVTDSVHLDTATMLVVTDGHECYEFKFVDCKWPFPWSVNYSSNNLLNLISRIENKKHGFGISVLADILDKLCFQEHDGYLTYNSLINNILQFTGRSGHNPQEMLEIAKEYIAGYGRDDGQTMREDKYTELPDKDKFKSSGAMIEYGSLELKNADLIVGICGNECVDFKFRNCKWPFEWSPYTSSSNLLSLIEFMEKRQYGFGIKIMSQILKELWANQGYLVNYELVAQNLMLYTGYTELVSPTPRVLLDIAKEYVDFESNNHSSVNESKYDDLPDDDKFEEDVSQYDEYDLPFGNGTGLIIHEFVDSDECWYSYYHETRSDDEGGKQCMFNESGLYLLYATMVKENQTYAFALMRDLHKCLSSNERVSAWFHKAIEDVAAELENDRNAYNDPQVFARRLMWQIQINPHTVYELCRHLVANIFGAINAN